MPLAAIDLTDGAVALIVTIALAVVVRIVRGAASKRESPQERATRLLMRSMEDLADRFDDFKREYGPGCVWRDGRIPEHVVRWAKQIVTEADNDRLRRERK